MINGDEDSIAQASHFRHEMENLLATTIPGTSVDYTTVVKVISPPFRDHGNPAGESTTIERTPQAYTSDMVQPSSTSSTVDWLIDLAENNTLTDPTTPPEVDEGINEPNSKTDYRFNEFLFTSPPETEAVNGLNLDPAWLSPSGVTAKPGFLGTGDEAGLNDNTLAANIDGDTKIEVVYGDNSGFLYIYEWNRPSKSSN